MLTLFSIPKAFAGRTGTMQDNAVGSWARLGCDCEIILFGDDPGVAEAAARHGVRHEPCVARNEQGTPILDGIFARVDAMARHPIIGFVNADIILLEDFLALPRMAAGSRGKFLMVSSRFNCRIEAPLSFRPGWSEDLRVRARTEARMYPAGGSDIFVYPRGLFGTVPPFAVGRGYWDNWLMRQARRNGARLIDTTEAVTAVHQDHDYTHIAGASPGAADGIAVLATHEGERNLVLAGGRRRLYTVYDATQVLTSEGRLVSTLLPFLVRRRAKAWLRRQVAAIVPGAPFRLRTGTIP